METIRSTIAFEEFSGSNFVTWQTRVELLLTRDGVWNIVKGTDEKPEGSDTSPKVKAWNDRNDHALAHIGLGLADNPIHHLDLDKPANEAGFTSSLLKPQTLFDGVGDGHILCLSGGQGERERVCV